jgi:trimeric autotransporter adhesin
MKTRRRIVSSIALLVPTVAVSVPAHAQTDNSKGGAGALANNTTGSHNTAFGANALNANRAESYNTAFGSGALQANTTGSRNTATGRRALWKNTSGMYNTADGLHALHENLYGSYNVAVGAFALELNGTIPPTPSTTPGYNNTAVGYSALANTTIGTGNTAVGAEAVFAADGDNNTALGSFALGYTTGSSNTAVGMRAAENCGGCNNITAMGYLAQGGPNATALGASTFAFDGGVAVGHLAKAEGTNSIALGSSNGAGTSARATGSSAIALGNAAQATGTNSVALGSGAVVTSNNTIRIGNTAITQIIGSATTVNLSDGRYKTNVRENVPGLEFITKLRPVTFKWQIGKLNKVDGVEELATDPVFGEAREAKAKKVHTGFIAQDVEAAAEQCGYDFSGVVKPENEESQYHLGYSEFVVPLVKAVQEQQKQIEELQKTVRALASDSRLPSGRLGAAAAPATSQHASVLGSFWGGAMTLLSAWLVLMHLKRRRESAAAR